MTVAVLDPRGAAHDPTMTFLARALDPEEAESRLARLLGGPCRVVAIRVARYKPRARCLVEYELLTEDSGTLTVLGKARAWGLDEPTYRLNEELWRRGFSVASEDGISIPKPLGVVPEFRMWFQHKVPGALAGDLLPRPGGVALGRRIAEALHKLHASGAATTRHHTIHDELAVLHERLGAVATSRAEWAPRIRDLLSFCDRLADGIAESESERRGVHRDFYQDQVIVDAGRLYLLDLDLYARGEPAIDAGNFLAHLTEWGLRNRGDPRALVDAQAAFERRFLELAGGQRRPALQAYAFLSLVRHVSISTQTEERRSFTERILRLCETQAEGLPILSA